MVNTLFLAIILHLLSYNSDDVILVEHNKTTFNIVTGTNADNNTLKCAAVLNNYFKKIADLAFSVTPEPEPGKKSIFIGAGAVKDKSLLGTIEGLGKEGFVILIESERIILAGKEPEATYNAIVTFLEENLGCMRFTGSDEYIPSNSSVSLREQRKIYEPAFRFRYTHFMDRQNEDYLAWNKLSSFDDWGLYVHTFQVLCPQEKYFDAHPGYFSLVNGERIRDGQLCLSNSEVIKLLGDNLSELMAKQPGKNYWSVSQNDCINFCECENCKKLYLKYGNVSGAYIEMANALAERFPDKQISTLAYQFTRQAPVNIVPRENVNIMFCSIECNRSMPLGDDPRSAGFVTDMKSWEKLSRNIYVWDYVVQFKTYLCPFPNIHVLQPNIRFFRDHHAAMMFQQGSGDHWSDLGELKQYLISKLLWDPDIDADSVISRFIEKYYGPASQYIARYQYLTDSLVSANQDKWGLDIYGLPSFYFKTFLTGPLLSEYKDLMDKAEQSVAGDPVYLKRVKRTRCAVDFAYMDYALYAGDPAISFIDRAGGRNTMNPELVKMLDKFIADCSLTGITNIGEEKLTVNEYRDHIITINNLSVISNKAEGKKIKTLTPFNPRYSQPGVKTLTDGIFGGRHFNSGWLGYEGVDMVVEIDLGKKENIHRVSMNFLRDFVSWIFLPDTVIVELSENGKTFREVARITNTLSDRRFGVEPVYHSLDFAARTAKYVRIKAISIKKCPGWHRGAGMPAWIFSDEIIVE